ncbi:Hypothetical_protein [Hexamita inflata]|uniref:Hypothetical_protein n=1 Tax=Hexamita inflata TaxID=28002 RepID=A0AA86N8C2_9EUKA|nr:Hypothetical protein HINF_LOCUS2577 [Hexamita inflata]
MIELLTHKFVNGIYNFIKGLSNRIHFDLNYVWVINEKVKPQLKKEKQTELAPIVTLSILGRHIKRGKAVREKIPGSEPVILLNYQSFLACRFISQFYVFFYCYSRQIQ